MLKQLFFLLFLIFFLIMETYSQKKEIYSLFRQLEENDTILTFDNNYLRIGEIFDDESKNAILIYPLSQNIFLLEILEFKPESWNLIQSDTVEFGSLSSVYFEDLNDDGLRDLILKTSGGGVLDILFLTDKGLWHQSNYFNVNYKNLGENFYYTYKAVGCADGAWRSNLLSFKGNSVEEHVELYVEACTDTPYEAIVYAIENGKKKMIEHNFTGKIGKNSLKEFWLFFVRNHSVGFRL